MTKRIAIILIMCCPVLAIGQNSVFNCHSYQPYDKFLYKQDTRFHTAIKPYDLQDVNKFVCIDSLYEKHSKNKILDYILNKDLISYHSKDFNFTINPTFNFELSRHNGENDDKTGWINDRGIFVKGNITDKVHFYTAFHEIQSQFFDYRRDIINSQGLRVSGIGGAKYLGDEKKTLDYSYVEGYAAYIPNKFFSFQLGHGKHFFGDGYRSLLLSDNASNYPYFKATFNYKNIRYTSIWAQQYYVPSGHQIFVRYSAKWNMIHYLDWSATKWLSLGLFEAIVTGNDSLNTHTFDVHYINPLPWFPQEHNGYKDNCIIGFNAKIVPYNNHCFYTQFILNTNNFKCKELFNGDGYWGNRYGFQIGYKTFNIANIQHLDFQTEINYVRPYTYTHQTKSESYSHARQALAHPCGANFVESISFLRYNWKRIFVETKFEYLVYGADTTNAYFGHNIEKQSTTIANEYNATTLQGNKTTTTFADISLSYLINPKYNMMFSLGTSFRNTKTETTEAKQCLLFVGFRTCLSNFYYDY